MKNKLESADSLAVNSDLRELLGGTCCGPSLSYDREKERFVIYEWSDAPVSVNELAVGDTLSEVIENYREFLRDFKNNTKKGKKR